MKIDKVRTSPYHASCNGMLERYHRCLNSLLAKIVSVDQRNWSDHLPTVVAAYRATVHESTRLTPNRAFLRRELRMPVDLVMGTSPESHEVRTCVSDMIQGIVERMRDDGAFVRLQLGKAATSMKTRYDPRLKPAYDFAVGDQVLYFYPRRYAKRSPKWQNLYVGPYIVLRFLDPCNVVISRPKGGRRWSCIETNYEPSRYPYSAEYKRGCFNVCETSVYRCSTEHKRECIAVHRKTLRCRSSSERKRGWFGVCEPSRYRYSAEYKRGCFNVCETSVYRCSTEHNESALRSTVKHSGVEAHRSANEVGSASASHPGIGTRQSTSEDVSTSVKHPCIGVQRNTNESELRSTSKHSGVEAHRSANEVGSASASHPGIGTRQSTSEDVSTSVKHPCIGVQRITNESELRIAVKHSGFGIDLGAVELVPSSVEQPESSV